jgi:oxaloacetate decarboxylase beta subunit
LPALQLKQKNSRGVHLRLNKIFQANSGVGTGSLPASAEFSSMVLIRRIKMIRTLIIEFLQTLGLQDFGPGRVCMIAIGCVLIYLGIRKRYEPLLLIPIGFGVILCNIPIRDTVLLGTGGIVRQGQVVEFTLELPPEGLKFDRFSLVADTSPEFRAELEEVSAISADAHGPVKKDQWKKVPAGIQGKTIQVPADVYQSMKVKLRTVAGDPGNLTGLEVSRLVGMMDPGGLLYLLYHLGITTSLFPLLIFLGIGALTDFGPLLADPKTALLGAAAQLGIFVTLLGALGLGFTMKEAASIGIIGGADGPTSIYITSKLADHLLGPIAIAAYSYMAMVPIIQPPIMRLLTSKRERAVKMEQLRPISTTTRILFPIIATALSGLLVPSATPLIGMLMFGNLLRECGAVERLAKTASNELINIVTIFLGLAVGGKMDAASFLTLRAISILMLGFFAFAMGTAGGVLFGKLMCALSRGRINPLIGAAGVSAVPMSARVVELEGLREDPYNHLLMHAMGPNVAGVIGSAIVAGYFLSVIPR